MDSVISVKFCMVDGRGGFRKAEKYCPLLNTKDSDVECVIATDRYDPVIKSFNA